MQTVEHVGENVSVSRCNARHTLHIGVIHSDERDLLFTHRGYDITPETAKLVADVLRTFGKCQLETILASILTLASADSAL